MSSENRPVSSLAGVDISLKLPTRQARTEDEYLKRALWFEGYAARMMSSEDVSPQETAACAIERKREWTSNTWRQVKASLVFRYEAMRTPGSLEAVRMLKAETQEGTVRRSSKTSARRKKNVSDKDLLDVLLRIQLSKSAYAQTLSQWLSLGSLFGLRPHEWAQSTVVMLSQADIEAKGDASVRRPYLRIQNGKATNGRSHGQFRHLSLVRVAGEDIDRASEFTIFMASIKESGEYEKYYKGCRALLDRITRTIGGPSAKRLQIYSPRHKFAASAKKEFSPQEVGCLMGHGTDRTAPHFYGKAWPSSGGLTVSPLAGEVSRVKQTKSEPPVFLAKRASEAPGSDQKKPDARTKPQGMAPPVPSRK